MGILCVSKIKNPSGISKVYAQQWLNQIFGKSVYQYFWEPLLRSKFGDAKDKASAAFIWSIISRSYRARNFGSKQEKMGHVRGRYHTILSAAQRRLTELNVNAMINVPVIKVEAADDENRQIIVTTREANFRYDKVLFTIPCPEILKILNVIDNHAYWKKLHDVEYIEVICVLLILKRKLSRYYVINLLDKDLPFTGIIEATNIVPAGEAVDNHLIYLPKYIPSDDTIKNLNDLEIKNLFVKKLKNVFSDFKTEEILHTKIFREKYVQPFYDLNFLDRRFGFKTPISNIFIANTSMIYDSTLNNNAAIRIAMEAVRTIIADHRQHLDTF
jgi:protoporphyrinogen oxidase